MSERINRYPFSKTYARNSAIIFFLAVLVFSLLTYPSGSSQFYQNTAAIGTLFAAMMFGGRYFTFRKILRSLKEKGRVRFEKGHTPEKDIIKRIMSVGILIALILPIASIRLMDPLSWLAALLGYIGGVNLGELAYYLFIRNMESSIGSAIYTMDYVDPITGQRIVGYALEKTGN